MLNTDKENIYIAIDFETGGVSPETHSIVEFGVAIIKNLKVVESLGSLIQPYSLVEEKYLNYSGIKQSDLDSCGFRLKDMIDTLIGMSETLNPTKNKYKKPYLVGHNIERFDLKWLKFAFEKFKLNWEDYFNYIIYDTLPLCSLMFYNNIKIGNKKLATICKFLEVEERNSHHAEDDAIMVGEVFIKCLKFYSSQFDKVKINSI